ncbi:MAG: tetratricopeptide repeat protein [Prolixibacteraceae bacterium]|nr:tetratricopeptide repeat protein [Prolixibacteraceae bacterium]
MLKQYDQAQALYQSANYIAAERLFADLQAHVHQNDPIRFDVDYYWLICLVKQQKSNSEQTLSEYLKVSNGSPWENQLWFELARLQFINKRFPLAARTFQNVDPRYLNKADKDDYAFFKGYSHFEAGNLKEASQSFFEVRRSSSIYAPSATYYWGYINYLEGNYETALDEFSKLENNREFAGFIKYYTTQIYYIQEKYEKVIEYGEKLIGGAPAEQKNELLKIVGDAFYETGQYISAVKYLETFKGVNGKKTPEDYYRLGYCYYQMKDFGNAITAFEKATFRKDQLAQNAFYHLADCHLQQNNKNKARAAFEEASKYSFDPTIEEDALFNYAKLTYELSYSPFNETIKAFDQYIAKYPDSERNDAAFDYLVKVYMTTRNYRDAINSINKIKNQSSAVKEAYQRLTYFRGLELLNDGQYNQALEAFQLSLDNARYNRIYQAQALYWSADTYYRLRKFQQASALFEKFQSTPGAYSLPEFQLAYYNIAYCYFNQQLYNEATEWFRKFLNQKNIDQKMKADAANRVGDYYYLNREYAEAINYYHIAAGLNSYDPDYALFQQAICQGLAHQHNEKIVTLNNLYQSYPRSSFIDDALFETARTHDRTGNTPEAIRIYNQLTNEFPQSSFTSKAYLQLGLIYYNQSNYTASLGNYKKVVEIFPNSEEAKAALVGIKNNYIDLKQVDEYFAYTNTLGNMVVITANEQDSIFYMAAEKNYMDNDPSAAKQLENYLNRFPNGSFKVNALFYLAETYYQKGNYSQSMEYYKETVERPDHVFTEPALIKAAELTYNAKQYENSLSYFERLERLASSKWNLLRARLGLLRCHYALNQPSATVKTAITLLATDNVTEEMTREANYKLAKSYYLLNQDAEAYKYFKLISNDTKTVEGAESKYFVAQILYNQGKLNECENEIMDFISKNTTHQYWLAKSFLLLSDVYLSKKDTFQAKHTLNSIINNYATKDDGIITDAMEKIRKLEELERETIITGEASDSSSINE